MALRRMQASQTVPWTPLSSTIQPTNHTEAATAGTSKLHCQHTSITQSWCAMLLSIRPLGQDLWKQIFLQMQSNLYLVPQLLP